MKGDLDGGRPKVPHCRGGGSDLPRGRFTAANEPRVDPELNHATQGHRPLLLNSALRTASLADSSAGYAWYAREGCGSVMWACGEGAPWPRLRA